MKDYAALRLHDRLLCPPKLYAKVGRLNVNGQLLAKYIPESTTLSVDILDYPSGMYLIVVKYLNMETTETQKFIISK